MCGCVYIMYFYMHICMYTHAYMTYKVSIHIVCTCVCVCVDVCVYVCVRARARVCVYINMYTGGYSGNIFKNYGETKLYNIIRNIETSCSRIVRYLPLPYMYDSYSYNLPLTVNALQLRYKIYKVHSNYLLSEISKITV